MGKVLALLLGVSDLGLLALVVRPMSRGTVVEAGLVAAFAVVALLAWSVAFVTAVWRAVVRGHEWGWVLALAALLWLPALPAIAFGVSGVWAVTRRRRTNREKRRAGKIKVVTSERTAPLERSREPALVGAGIGTHATGAEAHA